MPPTKRGFVSDTPENRAHDIHSMFGDSEVKAIMVAIGGDHSCHLLPLLDFDLIRENPKHVSHCHRHGLWAHGAAVHPTDWMPRSD